MSSVAQQDCPISRVFPLVETPGDSAAVDQMQQAVMRAVDELKAVRARLLAELAPVPVGTPPLIDGREAETDLVTWLRDRVTDLCRHSSFADAITELEYQATADQLHCLAEYCREDCWGYDPPS